MPPTFAVFFPRAAIKHRRNGQQPARLSAFFPAR
jgi:hypothetical protein